MIRTSQLPIYNDYFSDAPALSLIGERDWTTLNSPKEDLARPLSQRPVDFSYRNTSWKAEAKRIALFAFKIILFPWGLYEGLRYLTQRLVLMALYPAQSWLVRYFQEKEMEERGVPIDPKGLNTLRQTVDASLRWKGMVVRHVNLEKNGVRYSGLLIGHLSTLANRQWILQSLGNFMWAEHVAKELVDTYEHRNLLLINGPSVGLSEGVANPESIGDAQEVGLTFLETAIQAKKITLAGYSFGGAAMAQAILQHDFRKDVQYQVISQANFDRASSICAERVGKEYPALKEIVRKLVLWTDCEMDMVAAGRKLQDEKIPHCIIQHTLKDTEEGIIPSSKDLNCPEGDGEIFGEASLAYRLVKEGVTQGKTFHCIQDLKHTLEELTDLTELYLAKQDVAASSN